MREIKFRGKGKYCEYEGKWLYGYLYVYNEPKIYSILNENDVVKVNIFGSFVPAFINVDSNTIGQYTGLKDKNGVEIYEGDIIDAVFEENGEITRNRAQVIFDNGCWVIKWQEFENTDYLYDDVEWLEVIGNIYDNPELLEED